MKNEWIIAVALIFFLAIIVYVVNQRDNLKKEAAERGFAVWATESNGSTSFQWKSKEEN